MIQITLSSRCCLWLEVFFSGIRQSHSRVNCTWTLGGVLGAMPEVPVWKKQQSFSEEPQQHQLFNDG